MRSGARLSRRPCVMLTQHYLACLSHASYLVADESTSRAVVVDPRRDANV